MLRRRVARNRRLMGSGQTGFTPAVLPSAGIVADWDLSAAPNSGGIVNGNAVDRIGGLTLAPQSSPQYIATAIGGYGAVRFNGTSSYLLNTTLSVAQPLEVWMVLKQITWVQFTSILGANGIVLQRQDDVTPYMSLYAGTGPNTLNASLPVGVYGISRAVYNGASSTLSVGWGLDSIVTGNPGTANLGAGFALGAYTAPSQFCNVEVSRLLFVNPGASGYSASALYVYLAQHYGSALNSMTVAGDSIPAGYSLTIPAAQSWAGVAQQSLSSYGSIYGNDQGYASAPVGGIHPSTTGTITSNAPSYEDIALTGGLTAPNNVLVLDGGTNDISFGNTAAQVKASIQTYFAGRRAAQPRPIKCVLFTVLPRTWLSDSYGTFTAKEAVRVALNADILASGAAAYGADVVVDVTTVTGASDPTNSTYYFNPDIGNNYGIHPTAALHANIAALLVSTIHGLGWGT